VTISPDSEIAAVKKFSLSECCPYPAEEIPVPVGESRGKKNPAKSRIHFLSIND
jgi:hypothetical protein